MSRTVSLFADVHPAFTEGPPAFTGLSYASVMRVVYYEQMDVIESELVAITAAVREATVEATIALLETDVRRAEQVIGGEDPVDLRLDELEERILVLLATQQPVASDLRQLVAALRMTADLQRMSALAVHVAKVARRRVPEPAVPDSAQPIIVAMSQVAGRMIESAAQIIAQRDVTAAARLEVQDDEMDRLRQDLFRLILGEDFDGGTEAAIDLALLGRYYERMGDHAVNMARRVVFLVTGEMPPTT